MKARKSESPLRCNDTGFHANLFFSVDGSLPKLASQPNGLKLSKAAGRNPAPTRRGNISGWSRGAARRNDDFLRSVRPFDLTGVGFSLSLTVKELPASHDDWETLRRSFVERLRRLGFIRLHWLTEFQRRGVPHLHGMVYFEDYSHQEASIVWHWLQLTRQYGARSGSQHVVRVNSADGWLMYLGKHGSRGVFHYQRSIVPKAWEKTGRLWGKSGDWPTSQVDYYLDDDDFFRVRRAVKRFLVAQARKEYLKALSVDPYASSKRLRYLRSRLKANTVQKAETRSSSDWLDPDIYESLVMATAQNVRPYDDRPVRSCPNCSAPIYRISSIVFVKKENENETLEDCITSGRVIRVCEECSAGKAPLSIRAIYGTQDGEL